MGSALLLLGYTCEGSNTCSGAFPLDSTWQYVGCVKDRSPPYHVMAPWYPVEELDMTVECCQSWCQSIGQPVAGLEEGNKCFCANGLPPINRSGAVCDAPCRGSQSEICGGTLALSLYVNVRTRTAATDPTAIQSRCTYWDPLPDGWSSLGCIEGNVSSVMTGAHADGQLINSQCCVWWCGKMGYIYAGMQNGTLCACGDHPPLGGNSSLQCELPCPADPIQSCGSPAAFYAWVSIRPAMTSTTSTTRRTTSAVGNHAYGNSGGVASALAVAISAFAIRD